MKGFTKTILEINLSKNSVKKTPLNEDIARKFLGGAGYACATLFPLLSKETDPLGPDNKLFFMTGPLTGTTATSSGRMVVCAKSPLTGIWGESNSGSDACIQLKKAGYDGILIHGKAKAPVYLEILDEQVVIKPADHLWGKGIYETTSHLKNLEKFKKPRVMAIGPAGENLVNFAIIGSEERAFGRTGMGAVMGSKNLKAIVIQGSGKIEITHPDEFKELTKTTNSEMMEIFTYEMMQELGTSGSLDMYSVSGELPIKYYRGSEFENTDEISGSTLAEKYLKKNHHCFACPIGCGRIVELGENGQKLPTIPFEGPEYETMAGFGSLMMNEDLEAIIKANYLCNDLGLDTISSSSMIALLMDLVERRKLKPSDIDGISLQFGKMDEVFDLLEKIALRQGIGNIIAEGSQQLIKDFAIDPEQVATIHNSHVTYHDMRSTSPMAIAYGISPHYGGSHNSCDGYMVTTGLEIPDLGISLDGPYEEPKETAIVAGKLMEYRAFYSAAIFCVFANPPPKNLAKYLELALGEPFTMERIVTTGQRILTLKRLFNLKMGHTPQDEHIPKILLEPLPESGSEGQVPDVATLFSEFYSYMEWDKESGIPLKDKIKRLELESYSI
ncbi:Tungsten-containing aldehyde ferredoxin oxidoreductase [Candidatus Lokiarchaeum ossiferum]|uniref:Tungsten-containing aldehyde ferredoxin oxidoreductase n=1 Tax=Candidatus Lokiarchaeum ossiferum TaxID=2951803 RepID=A0ABY6HRI1_9ARCH|nr:Tungsten-containing aldehyde ferredoxin oxidoreductase [Candidatus Lokiarchaeum sp. B-35]